MPQVQKGFSDITNSLKSGKWKNLTVKVKYSVVKQVSTLINCSEVEMGTLDNYWLFMPILYSPLR